MSNYKMLKKVYYLSYQDGRVDEEEFTTPEAAHSYLNKNYPSEKKSICIMSYEKEVKFD